MRIWQRAPSHDQVGEPALHGPPSDRLVALGHGLAARAGDLGWRYPYHLALAALVAGLLSAQAAPTVPLFIASLAAIVGAAARRPGLALLAAGLTLGGAALGSARLAAIDHLPAGARPGASIDATAELLERPHLSRFGSSARLTIASGPGRGARLMARAPRHLRWPAGAGPGTEVAVRGEVRELRNGPGATFDYAAHLRRQGIGAQLRLDGLRATGRDRGGLAGWVDGMRRRAETALDRDLSPERSALMRGLVLGQDEAIAEPVREDFRASGLGHLLAVSGQNVMLLSALAWPLLAAAGAGIRLRRAALLGLIAVYVPLAGAGPSLQRAGVMGAAGVVALAAGRPASKWYALLLAAAITLALNPRASGDAGWQLSFAAVVGIVWLAPALRRPLGRLPRPLAEGIAMTVAATLATAPLLAHHFETIPLAGLPANLLALPAVAPVMWAGMLAIALAQLGALSAGWERAAGLAAKPIAALADLLLAFLEEVARRAAALPGSQLDLSLASGWSVILAYVVLAGLVLGARRIVRSTEPSFELHAAAWRRGLRRHRGAALAAATGLLVLAAMRLAAPAAPPEHLTVSFLDVGQGDATLIQHPDGSAVLFDGGPPEAGVHRLLREAGVTRLSAVVATHASRDHHGGLAEVVRRVPVDLLLDGGDGTTDPDFRALEAEADRHNVRRLPATAGQRIRAGGLVISVLSPPPRAPGPAPEDPNPRAVVAVVSAGDFDLFLSADAESEAFRSLDLPDVEAMKVPHHGSRDPGLPAVLHQLRPQVAAIEVGRDNGYGHPAPSTLAALQAAVPRVYRTDEDGTVRLTVEGSALEVATMGKAGHR